MPSGTHPPGQVLDSPASLNDILREMPRPLWLLLVLALVLPALLVGALGWQRHTEVLGETEHLAQRSVIALEQHIGSVLQTHALLLRQISDQTRGKSWEQIATDETLQHNLTQLVSNFEQVSLIGIADAEGRLRTSSVESRVAQHLMLADRDYFLAHRDGTADGIFFSAPFAGRDNSGRLFAISIARTDAAGKFDGIIFATVSLDYFARFWDQFVPSAGYVIPLMREDGTMLMRYPTADMPRRLDPGGPFVSRVRKAPRGLYTAVSQVDGIERTNAYRRVNNFPLYISFSIETRVALQKWRDDMLPALIMAMLATAALVALSLIVIRRSYQQRQVAARWRQIAVNLESEIARREAAEAKLHQAQKMEAFGQLTGGIAHDFNNMLAGIAGNLELIRVRMDRGETGAILQCVDRAETVIERAARLIQRLLTFARRKTLTAVPVRVNGLLQSATDMLQDGVGPRIHIETVLPDTSPVALCDPAQLESALLNLVINARDAMPEGGRITISASTEAEAAGGTDGKPSHVVISVSDTGIGMSQEVIDRAFEPFFTTKGIGAGSGLGLSMVFGFVQQSGGHVKIDSRLQAGTTVTLTLPAFEGEMEDAEQGPGQAPSPDLVFAGAVLLIEDEAAVRQVLTEVLQQSGASVLQAGSAEDALRIIEANPALDLVVTDIGLPGEMNGYQLADAARRTRPELRFLFISGYSGANSAAEASVLSQDRVLSKPFRTAAFLEALAGMQRNRGSQAGEP